MFRKKKNPRVFYLHGQDNTSNLVIIWLLRYSNVAYLPD